MGLFTPSASRLATNATGSSLTLNWEGTFVGSMGDSIPGTTNLAPQYSSSLRGVQDWAISGAGWIAGGGLIPLEYARLTNQTRILVEGGVNDINSDVTAAALSAVVIAFVNARLAEGKQVVLSNISPYQGYGSWTAPRQVQVDAYNAAVAAFALATPAVKFIDINVLFRNPALPLELLPAYDSGDHLHPNPTAGAAWAAAIAAVAP